MSQNILYILYFILFVEVHKKQEKKKEKRYCGMKVDMHVSDMVVAVLVAWRLSRYPIDPYHAMMTLNNET